MKSRLTPIVDYSTRRHKSLTSNNDDGGFAGVDAKGAFSWFRPILLWQ
jgi:hypothetical protein